MASMHESERARSIASRTSPQPFHATLRYIAYPPSADSVAEHFSFLTTHTGASPLMRKYIFAF